MEVGMGAGGWETGKHGSRDGGRWVEDRKTWKLGWGPVGGRQGNIGA